MHLIHISNLKFVKSPIILLCDLILSLLATYGTVAITHSIVGTWYPFEHTILPKVAASAIITLSLLLLFRLNKDIIRYISLLCILKISLIAFLKVLLLAGVFAYFTDSPNTKTLAPLVSGGIIDFLATTFLLVIVRVVMIGSYRKLIRQEKTQPLNTFFYGTTGLNPSLIQQINDDVLSKHNIVGFLSTNPDIVGHYICGSIINKAQQSPEALAKLFAKKQVTSVIFASYERFQKERDGVVEFCLDNKINMLVAGKITKANQMQKATQIKDIQIEDILNREEIVVDRDAIQKEVENQIVLVTGAAGSIGSEIAHQLASLGVKQLVLLDTAETPMHNLRLSFEERHPSTHISYKIGDVRSKQRTENILSLYKPSIVFHAAAYKHVPLMEENPCESVLTNVWGTFCLAQRAKAHGVRKFIMISTDKAVNPTNIMGATKRLAEMYIQSLNEEGKTEFITTRFGNVLGSNGSVIPLFKKQIKRGGPITVTHPDIIRYFMTIPEACRLVLQAATIGQAGQILVFDMGKPEKIVDLATKMIRLAGLEPGTDIRIQFTGLRPGEKLYEELLATKEETLPSSHEKIRLAKCICQDNEKITEGINELITLAKTRNISQVVMQLKQLVPEFKSSNSKEFEKIDQLIQKENTI